MIKARKRKERKKKNQSHELAVAFSEQLSGIVSRLFHRCRVIKVLIKTCFMNEHLYSGETSVYGSVSIV